MTTSLKQHYGATEGPLGFPQTDQQARALEAILKELPRDEIFSYRKWVSDDGPSEVLSGERTDVSWISTEDPDRVGEVVCARGMDDRQFALNPIVTLNHCYTCPPVGKSIWRKRVRDGERVGIKAKTRYPARPEQWPEDIWPSDAAFALVRAGLLRGKSIGFLPTKVHVPDADERREKGWGGEVRLVIDAWILLEYACVFLPAQQHALVEHVANGTAVVPETVRRALGIEHCAIQRKSAPAVACVGLEEIVTRVLTRMDWRGLAERCIEERIDRMRGRI